MNIILRSRPLLIQHCFISCNFFFFTGEWLVEFTVPIFCGGEGRVNFTLSSGKWKVEKVFS